jgi:hypothetical protein
VFIVCGKKVCYSDAKTKELHVFPQNESFNDSGHIDLRKRVARGSSVRAASRAGAIGEETRRERKSDSLFSIFARIHRAKIHSI